ncbi:hypothetical protein [Pelobacter propionicus]|uniref:hypothetical protein n=1 Tax=Pelobacter propionicus TaxID=29543 RepID=UPI00030F2827|nr:hypothetical protein [Pelobacter propionicus]
MAVIEFSESWELWEVELRTRILDNDIRSMTGHSKKMHNLLERKKAEQKERIRAARENGLL